MLSALTQYLKITKFHSSPFRILRDSPIPIVHTIQFFYLLCAALALQILPQWPTLLHRDQADFLWPLSWATQMPQQTLVFSILSAHLIGTLSATWFPQLRATRILAFIGIFFFVAWNNSFGKIGHSTHLYVLLSFLWIFIPNSLWKANPSRKVILNTLDIFYAARFLILLTYSLAGASKLIGGIYQLLIGQSSLFSFNAMSRHIAGRLLDSGSTSFAGDWLIAHPLLGLCFLWGALYFQLFAVIVHFRPHLATLWAIGLSLFHIGSYFTLTIHFPHNILLLSLFFILYQPPHLAQLSLKELLTQTPILRLIILKIARK